MKVYVVTHESEWDGWIGTSVHASRDAAARYINERIDEINEDEDEKYTPVAWPEGRASVCLTVGSHLYHCQEDNLLE